MYHHTVKHPYELAHS